jgi:hypothetical protein
MGTILTAVSAGQAQHRKRITEKRARALQERVVGKIAVADAKGDMSAVRHLVRVKMRLDRRLLSLLPSTQ